MGGGKVITVIKQNVRNWFDAETLLMEQVGVSAASFVKGGGVLPRGTRVEMLRRPDSSTLPVFNTYRVGVKTNSNQMLSKSKHRPL